MHLAKSPLAPIAVSVSLLILFAVIAGAQTEAVLFSFANDGSNGMSPEGALVFDAAGNLYGTTSSGGRQEGCGQNCGTIFELSPSVGGGWAQQVLYEFSPPDGYVPAAGVAFDKSGNLYGTTYVGGANDCGVVFELSPQAGGTWTQKVLYSFTGSPDGCEPESGVIFDAAGNLYGMTAFGGNPTCPTFPFSCGIVFELMPQPDGSWKEEILHSFSNARHDGYNPWSAGLVFDAIGNLYGTTSAGGSYQTKTGFGGTVFELSPKKKGRWSEKILHSFGHKKDGTYPQGNLVFDANGNIYGMTYAGGANSYGTVFELSPKVSGRGWIENVIHSLNYNGVDGYEPHGPSLIIDAAGNLYGTTNLGGTADGGIVFELTPGQGGAWTEEILHNFSFNDGDGNDPSSGLIFDSAGNLYGTTIVGGAYNGGTVFEILP
ncbi:MAG: choice-of-anchor tandem repeat GloVer-containing protein [Terriglobales bacterium]